LPTAGHRVGGEVTAVERRVCTLCGEWSPPVLTVLGHRICAQCERRLVTLEIHDPDYDLWVNALRRLWVDGQFGKALLGPKD
jgi:hypothetical protein